LNTGGEAGGGEGDNVSGLAAPNASAAVAINNVIEKGRNACLLRLAQ